MSASLLLAQKQPCGNAARSADYVSQPPVSMSSDISKHLSDAHDRFCRLLALAEDRMAAGDYPAAIGLAQVAARYTFPGNVGLFGSSRFERLLLELGKRIPSAPPRGAGRRAGGQRNVLHILSYGRPVGGDSRCAWRWMQEDQGSRHSVAITAQADFKGVYDVPEALKQSAEKSGGWLRILSAPTSKPLEQARELRTLCQEMDVVVLHLFPYDIIPVLALAADCDPVKTLFVNHADHTFWVGAGVSHLIVHLRRQPLHFPEQRRGLNPERSSVLPIPMVYAPPTVTREQAKRALGYGPETTLLLTIASPFKYSSPGRTGFLDLVSPIMAKHPQAVLIAVGPEAKGAWQAAKLQTGGRIVPLGTRWDTDLLYAAADIYLDPVPFSSITSLLEAGSHGVPLLGYRLPEAELALLGPGAPGLEETMELANDPESYRALLERLITDTEFRCQSGRRVQAQILSLHTGKNWVHAVHDLYARVERTGGRGCLLGGSDVFDASALNVALVQLYGRVHPRKMIGKYIGALPYRSRLPITWQLHRNGFDLCFLNLLPSPADVIARRAGRWVRKIMRQLLRFR
jgi:hypothetical protein